jgi:hypothetical protein
MKSELMAVTLDGAHSSSDSSSSKSFAISTSLAAAPSNLRRLDPVVPTTVAAPFVAFALLRISFLKSFTARELIHSRTSKNDLCSF